MRTVGVKLIANIADYMSGIKRAGGATKDFAGQLDKMAKGGQLDKVADRAAVAGLGIAGIAVAAVKSAADFDKSMSSVAAATHASAKEIGQLRAAALQAGKDTSFSATEAADGITELSKAGVGTADVLGGGLKGALDLAAAGQLSVGEAAETAASALTQFKLKGSDVPHVADLLAAAAGKAQGSVHDMGYALGQSGLVANQFGLKIEDATGTLAAFASAGLIGSDAGTSFKTMLLALANPADKTKDLMSDLGIAAYDAQGKFVGITNLAQQLHDKLGKLTQAQRDAALAQIFGTDAIRAANVLYQQGGAGIQDWINKVNTAGFASETARLQTDNLAGDIERLKGSLETLAIESGGGATGGLRTLAKAANALVDQIGMLPSGITGTMTVVAGLTGTLLVGAAGWVKMRRSTAEALEELRSTGPVGEKAAAGLQKTTKWAGRAAGAFAAVEIAATAINAVGGDLNPQLDALTSGLQKFSTTGEVSGEAARLLGGDMGKLDTAMKDVADTGRWSSFARGFSGAIESISGTGHAFDDSLTNSKDRLNAVDQALQQLVQGGHADQAAQIFSTLADRAAKQGVSTNELKAVLPGYAASLETAGTAASGLADATGQIPGATDAATGATKKYKTAADAAAGAARGEKDAFIELSEAMKAEADPVFGLLKASESLTDAQKKASAAIKKHGTNSKEAKEATRDLAMAAIDLQGKVGDLGSTFDGKLSPSLVQTLRSAGLTDKEIGVVARQFKEAKKTADAYAGNYAAHISAPGAAAATHQIRTLKAELKSMKTNWSVTIRQNFLTFGKPYSQAGIASGNVGGLAGGGPVEGPGPKGVDSELRLLAPGEHVLSAPEVDAMGGHAAVAAMRSAALAPSVQNFVLPPTSGVRMMPASVAPQRVIVETRNVVEFAGGADVFGQLMAHTLRVKPGVRATVAKTLGVPG